ncbi:hypothetical protein BDZ97DRAFT_1756822 [Flammula alnicola]|nr:hypothetical protein BDZ97DRAFT_1756822 [Flammula alnicola]
MSRTAGEHCEACAKHVQRTIGCPNSTSCERCLPPGQLLKTCASCKTVRYCSKACQKAHWPEHKICCRTNSAVRNVRKSLGDEVEAKHKSFVKWCDNARSYAAGAAISALGILEDWKRIDTHVFLVEVKTVAITPENASLGGSRKSRFNYRHSLKSARCASMEEIHSLFDWRYKAGPDLVEFMMAHRPGLMRMLFLDPSLPKPLDHYTAPIDLTVANLLPYNPNWSAELTYTLNQHLPMLDSRTHGGRR